MISNYNPQSNIKTPLSGGYRTCEERDSNPHGYHPQDPKSRNRLWCVKGINRVNSWGGRIYSLKSRKVNIHKLRINTHSITIKYPTKQGGKCLISLSKQ